MKALRGRTGRRPSRVDVRLERVDDDLRKYALLMSGMIRVRPICMLLQPKPSSCSLPRLSPLFDADSRCSEHRDDLCCRCYSPKFFGIFFSDSALAR